MSLLFATGGLDGECDLAFPTRGVHGSHRRTGAALGGGADAVLANAWSALLGLGTATAVEYDV